MQLTLFHFFISKIAPPPQKLVFFPSFSPLGPFLAVLATANHLPPFDTNLCIVIYHANRLNVFSSSLINLLFGLPLDFLPATSNLSVLPLTYSLSFLLHIQKKPHTLASLAPSARHLACFVPLMDSFLIRSGLFQYKEKLSILISAASCLFLTTSVFKPLTRVLSTLPFTLADNLLSHITADMSFCFVFPYFQPFQPACTRFCWSALLALSIKNPPSSSLLRVTSTFRLVSSHVCCPAADNLHSSPSLRKECFLFNICFFCVHENL